ncbi:hypothetical protein [Sphingobium abikonense]|uniref:hypothetical protein n=1 Tax=Sphingobium abikonense TaxID=86193 RepID=UPI003518CE9A
MPDQVRHDEIASGGRMTGGKVIALSWLTFAALILGSGSAWLGWYIAVPVLLLWLTGIYFILRRKASR